MPDSWEARRAIARFIAISVVMQTVNNIAFTVKEGRYNVEKLVTPQLKLPPHSVGNQVCILDTSGCP
jgi:hypothetical protein